MCEETVFPLNTCLAVRSQITDRTGNQGGNRLNRENTPSPLTVCRSSSASRASRGLSAAGREPDSPPTVPEPMALAPWGEYSRRSKVNVWVLPCPPARRSGVRCTLSVSRGPCGSPRDRERAWGAEVEATASARTHAALTRGLVIAERGAEARGTRSRRKLGGGREEGRLPGERGRRVD